MLFGRRLVTLGVFAALLLSPGLIGRSSADGGANHQTRNQHFGVSGGNVNDASRAFCCSGTLGSLVTIGGTHYILSNNHVLARSDQAVAGEDISQPGLIDNGCRIPPIVADFTVAAQLGSNVDAALAQLRTGQMDSTGFIEDIGVPSSTLASPSVGLAVAKSGRTTGFTTGTIGSINTSVNVQYQRGCNSGKKFVVSYTNQVVINSSSFSAGGDSGSLIVTNNASHNPVALLFAGSSTTTIANPIREVMTKLSAALGGGALSFSGTAGNPNTPLTGNSPFPQDVERATRAKGRHERDLMSRPGVIGVGVGDSGTGAIEATIVVYIDRTAGRVPELPDRLEDVRVRVILTDPIIAY